MDGKQLSSYHKNFLFWIYTSTRVLPLCTLRKGENKSSSRCGSLQCFSWSQNIANSVLVNEYREVNATYGYQTSWSRCVSQQAAIMICWLATICGQYAYDVNWSEFGYREDKMISLWIFIYDRNCTLWCIWAEWRYIQNVSYVSLDQFTKG